MSEACRGTTPEERAQREKDPPRSATEVFSVSAPPLLDMKTYLDERALQAQYGILAEELIAANRLSMEKLRQWDNGRFKDHKTGSPTKVLYIKNLSSEVTELDLRSLFQRYERSDVPVAYRLMQRGRMKGQAFITFQDETTAKQAMNLVNGYVLKGRPIVSEFGRNRPQ